MKLSERLKGIISEHHLLHHPFYRAWSEGRLNLEVLRRYAGQYYAQVQAFPRFVSGVHSRCPRIEARKVLLQNLVDEELHGADHPELWMRFAEGMGVDRQSLGETELLPETKEMVNDFFELTEGPWTDGLCALFAYESQIPEVSATKIDGLKRFYGIEDDRSLSFFHAHLTYDVLHAKAAQELIDEHADTRSAQVATAKAANALWHFLDGVSREAGISA